MNINIPLPPPFVKNRMSAEDWLEESERSIVMAFRTLQALLEGKIDALNIRSGSITLEEVDIAVANATATNNSSTATNQATTATNQDTTEAGHVRYTDVAAASSNAVVSSEDLTQATPISCSIAGQPGYPRNVTLDITDSDTSITDFQITVTGTLADGQTGQTETFVFADGLSQTGDKAFAVIDSVTVDSISGDNAGDVLDVGLGNKLGLPVRNLSGVYKESVGNANETVGTVNTTYGTIEPTTSPDGTKSYDFWYTYLHTHTQDSHNHTQNSHTHSQIAHNHDLETS